jgi:hypothetical protein
MATLSKPKARINNVPTQEDKKKSRKPTGDINTFFSSDDFKDWCTGKSVTANKAKPLF